MKGRYKKGSAKKYHGILVANTPCIDSGSRLAELLVLWSFWVIFHATTYVRISNERFVQAALTGLEHIKRVTENYKQQRQQFSNIAIGGIFCN